MIGREGDRMHEQNQFAGYMLAEVEIFLSVCDEEISAKRATTVIKKLSQS